MNIAGRQPDSGKPTVRDENGGLQKRECKTEDWQPTRSSRVRQGVLKSTVLKSFCMTLRALYFYPNDHVMYSKR